MGKISCVWRAPSFCNRGYHGILFGTSRQDTFLGLSTEDNLFSFRPGVLQAFDSIVGGTGSFLDTIAFTSSARVQAGKFDVVSNIEVVRLDVPGIELTVSRQLVETSQTGFLTVEGSSGSDFVSGQPTNVNRAPVTGSIHFNGNGGADTFNGGEGDDIVTLNRADLGASTLNGYLGFDTLDIRGDGLISAASLANVSSFETFRLNGAQELFISQALFDTGLGSVVGDAGNQVVRADAVTTGGHNIYFNPGDGSDFSSAARKSASGPRRPARSTARTSSTVGSAATATSCRSSVTTRAFRPRRSARSSTSTASSCSATTPA
ncbi:hypothetical protein E6W36_10105 [Hankyongella ginsenosidimutans]|uniref:Calcium-binding protein n=1 Tax=Hankyongella ginsenosidimutans TaxID=1763828 RepID=A0A4D7BWF4_9SPHN|nr:hypothetical protein E6W36_10105 [Hankyongella ginsenosidimutans]